MNMVRGGNSRRKMFLLYSILGLALVHYQSCAPANEVFDQQAGGGSADVIDQVQVGAISFAQSKTSAFWDESVIVLGVCEQTGSLISWTLRDAEGEFIERGLSECHLGSFEVELSNQWQSYCNETLNLEAALGAKASSQTQVEAHCQ